MNDPQTLALDKAEVSLYQGLDTTAPPCLVLYSGAESGRRIDLAFGAQVLGRGSDADVRVDGRGVSRRHVRLTVTPCGCELHDLGSANASFVNDQLVSGPVALNDGDLLRLATVVLRYHARRSLDTALHDRLYRLATVDPGTGVTNRRVVAEAMTVEFTRARRNGRPLALLVADLDHFKQVNDAHGHPAGDAVLRDCATLLRAELRGGDVIGRWGGEEFVVLAPDTGADQAAALAERLRAAVAGHPFELPAAADRQATHHQQTVSIGVALQTGAMRDEHDLLAEADRMVYAAKHGGRNRVCVAAGR